jgi:hypothetical protein
VVVKVRERLAVNKQRLHRFRMERFNLKKLNKVGGKARGRSVGIVRSRTKGHGVCLFGGGKAQYHV